MLSNQVIQPRLNPPPTPPVSFTFPVSRLSRLSAPVQMLTIQQCTQVGFMAALAGGIHKEEQLQQESKQKES